MPIGGTTPERAASLLNLKTAAAIAAAAAGTGILATEGLMEASELAKDTNPWRLVATIVPTTAYAVYIHLRTRFPVLNRTLLTAAKAI